MGMTDSAIWNLQQIAYRYGKSRYRNDERAKDYASYVTVKKLEGSKGTELMPQMHWISR